MQLAMSDMISIDGGASGGKPERKTASYVRPLFAQVPELIFDRVQPVSRIPFAKKYSLHKGGISPKQLRLGTHCTEAEVERWFGPCVNHHGYKYCHLDDEEFIKEVELNWMICHQKLGMSNTRLINKAEARGYTWERLLGDRKREVNWACFAEWTCRDQLRRVQCERESLGGVGSVGGFGCSRVKAKVVDGEDCEGLEREIGYLGEEKKPSLQELTASTMLSRQCREVVEGSVAEWREHLSANERDMPKQEELVRRSLKEKVDSGLEVMKVQSQLEDRRQLVATRKAKMSKLKAELDAENVTLLALQSEDLISEGNVKAQLAVVESVQRRLDAQGGMVDAFEEMLSEGEKGFGACGVKLSTAKLLWELAAEKLESMRRHKKALSEQLEYIQARNRRPGFEPSPPDFTLFAFRENITFDMQPCPFCPASWEPTWELKLASCKCAYHSWCALTHFSSSLKCFAKHCAKEQHPEWWAKSGIKKPVLDDQGAVQVPWDVHNDANKQVSQDPLSTSISYSTVQHQGPVVCSRSNTLSPSVGGKTFSFLKPREEPMGKISPIQEQQLETLEKTPAKERGQSADGKRKKSIQLSLDVNPTMTEEFAVDVDDDRYTGTSDQAIEGNSPHEKTASSPLKKRKKGEKKAPKVPVARRVSTAKNTRAGKSTDFRGEKTTS